MNARHKRKGKALPKPGCSLTAAIAARCAAKTWYNERSPRRAGVTMAVRPRSKFCRHKERWMARELSLSPDVRDRGSTAKKQVLPAQGKMDGQGTIPLAGQARPWQYVREGNPAGTRKQRWFGNFPPRRVGKTRQARTADAGG